MGLGPFAVPAIQQVCPCLCLALELTDQNWVCVSGSEPQPYGGTRDIPDTLRSAGLSPSSSSLWPWCLWQKPFLSVQCSEGQCLAAPGWSEEPADSACIYSAPRQAFLLPSLPWSRAVSPWHVTFDPFECVCILWHSCVSLVLCLSAFVNCVLLCLSSESGASG